MANEVLKELRYKGGKVIAEVARRDASGQVIDATYATKEEFNNFSNESKQRLSILESSVYVYDGTEEDFINDFFTANKINNGNYISRNDRMTAFVRNFSNFDEFMKFNLYLDAGEHKIINENGEVQATFSVSENGTYDIFFRPSGNEAWGGSKVFVTPSDLATISLRSVINDSYLLVGSFNNWGSPNALKMYDNGSQAIYWGIFLHNGDEFKIIDNGTWYPVDVNFKINGTSYYDITYTKATHGITVVNSAFAPFYVDKVSTGFRAYVNLGQAMIYDGDGFKKIYADEGGNRHIETINDFVFNDDGFVHKDNLESSVQTSLDKADSAVQPATLNNYSLLIDAANSIELSIDPTTYILTASLKNKAGETLNSQKIDLPLETMVISGRYNEDLKEIELTLKNNQTISFSIADLISGLQSEITDSNKLSADLIQDGTTNKVFTATDKTTIATHTKEIDKLTEGVSSALVQIRDKQDRLSADQLAAVNSGITSSKVQTYDNYQQEIDSKQNVLVSGNNIKTINNISLLGSGNINLQESYLVNLGTLTETTGTFSAEITSNIRTALSSNKAVVFLVTIQTTLIQTETMLSSSVYFSSTSTSISEWIIRFNKSNKIILALTIRDNVIATPKQYSYEYSFITHLTESDLASKQDVLVSGTNIKSINNESLVGAGNINIGGALIDLGTLSTQGGALEMDVSTQISNILIPSTQNFVFTFTRADETGRNIYRYVSSSVAYSSTLYPIIQIFFNESYIDDGKIWIVTITTGRILPYSYSLLSSPVCNSTGQDIDELLATKQDILVSGENIKTVNNQSLLGSGNIDIQGEKGDKGDQGDPGYIYSGVIGFDIENGNLILYNEDTESSPDYQINNNGEMTITIN